MKITGIRAVCRESKDLHPEGLGFVLRVYVNRKTGRVWSDLHVSTNEWYEYDDTDVLFCGFIHFPFMMWQVRQMVEESLEEAEKGW